MRTEQNHFTPNRLIRTSPSFLIPPSFTESSFKFTPLSLKTNLESGGSQQSKSVIFRSFFYILDVSSLLTNLNFHPHPLLTLSLQAITCFGLSALSRRYIGFGVVALLVEINSVFLHLRQILRMSNMSTGTLYRVNSMVNLGTYVVFRINTLAWMTRWLVLNRDKVPLVAYTLGSVGLAIMTAMNIVLFYRLLRSDFLKSGVRENKKEKEM